MFNKNFTVNKKLLTEAITHKSRGDTADCVIRPPCWLVYVAVQGILCITLSSAKTL